MSAEAAELLPPDHLLVSVQTGLHMEQLREKVTTTLIELKEILDERKRVGEEKDRVHPHDGGDESESNGISDAQ